MIEPLDQPHPLTASLLRLAMTTTATSTPVGRLVLCSLVTQVANDGIRGGRTVSQLVDDTMADPADIEHALVSLAREHAVVAHDDTWRLSSSFYAAALTGPGTSLLARGLFFILLERPDLDTVAKLTNVVRETAGEVRAGLDELIDAGLLRGEVSA